METGIFSFKRCRKCEIDLKKLTMKPSPKDNEAAGPSPSKKK
jgi:hypothetical protein